MVWSFDKQILQQAAVTAAVLGVSAVAQQV
jgi:hypothetical protein